MITTVSRIGIHSSPSTKSCTRVTTRAWPRGNWSLRTCCFRSWRALEVRCRLKFCPNASWSGRRIRSSGGCRPAVRVLFFSDRGGDATLSAMNGKQYPQPPLVFKASGSRLWVRALKADQRPEASTVMHIAPYWNCDAQRKRLHRNHENSAGEISLRDRELGDRILSKRVHSCRRRKAENHKASARNCGIVEVSSE